jgi:hypothetical protein
MRLRLSPVNQNEAGLDYKARALNRQGKLEAFGSFQAELLRPFLAFIVSVNRNSKYMTNCKYKAGEK